jgi:hypothetical protein
MAGLQIRRVEAQDGVTLHLEGVFDGKTALDLRRAVDSLDARRVTIDFSSVGTFMDLAVAVLTVGFPDRDVALRGLPRHQERMFRYFGFITQGGADLGRYYRPEEQLAG